MAAVVRQAHPAWPAWQVRSAIVNTAQAGVLTQASDPAAGETDVQDAGSGLADLHAAVGAQLALSSVSTSFGAVPAGSGKALTRRFTVTNLSEAAVSGPLTVTGDTAFTVSPSVLDVAPGASQTVTVSFTAGKGGAAGERQATLDLAGAAHSVLFAFVK
jgi:hypothetical protein